MAALTQVLFVLEQHLGHRTYSDNLRRFVDGAGLIEAHWAPIAYSASHSKVAVLPGLPAGIRGALHGRAEVRRKAARVPHDVCFFNTQVPAALGGAFMRSKPYVVATDITPIQYDALGELYGHRPDRTGVRSWYKHCVNRRVFQEAYRVLPWSSWTANSLIRDYGVSPAKVEVVPPGVDLDLWRPRPQNVDAPVRILFVGGDFRRKGGETILRAFRSLTTGTAELHVVTRTQIAVEPGVYPHYGLRPNQPELVDLYRSADVFALPTEAEAFGIGAVEASASGLPVVATAIGGLGDIVVDGKTGFLVSAGDIEGFGQRVRTLVDSPVLREQMGIEARAHAERLFDGKRNAERTINVLLQAASQQRPGQLVPFDRVHTDVGEQQASRFDGPCRSMW